jgi:hypothetical protein
MLLSSGHIQEKESVYLSEARSLLCPVPFTKTRIHNIKIKMFIFFCIIEKKRLSKTAGYKVP